MRPLTRMVILAVVTTSAYASVARNGFVYDDVRLKPGLPARADISLVRPGRWLVSATWSTDPVRVHLENVGLHLVNGALVGGLAAALGLTSWWIAAGLMWLHPLNSEAVAYGAARTELLTALGILIGCVSVASAHRWRFIGVLAGGWLAMNGKESGVAVIGLVGLVAWTQGRLSRLMVIVAAALSLIALRGLPFLLAINSWAWTEDRLTAWRWLQLQTVATWRLLSLAVWPAGLSIDHDYAAAVPVFGPAAAVGVCGLAFLAWRVRHTWPMLTVGCAWMLIALAPRFIVRVAPSVLPEHQFYVPFIGVVLAVTSLVDQRVSASTI